MTKTTEQLKSELLQDLKEDLSMVSEKDLMKVINDYIEISFTYGYDFGYDKGFEDGADSINEDEEYEKDYGDVYDTNISLKGHKI